MTVDTTAEVATTEPSVRIAGSGSAYRSSMCFWSWSRITATPIPAARATVAAFFAIRDLRFLGFLGFLFGIPHSSTVSSGTLSTRLAGRTLRSVGEFWVEGHGERLTRRLAADRFSVRLRDLMRIDYHMTVTPFRRR
jgi:hypothetical protein